jgi:hypothetical protein
MQTKRNDVWVVSDKPSSNSVTLANSTGDVVVLDENSLENVNGGMILPPICPPIFPLPCWPPIPRPSWPPVIFASS